MTKVAALVLLAVVLSLFPQSARAATTTCTVKGIAWEKGPNSFLVNCTDNSGYVSFLADANASCNGDIQSHKIWESVALSGLLASKTLSIVSNPFVCAGVTWNVITSIKIVGP